MAQRRRPKRPDDEEALIDDIAELVRQYGRYGYRKIAELLRSTAGWVVNNKRVERLWRRGSCSDRHRFHLFPDRIHGGGVVTGRDRRAGVRGWGYWAPVAGET